MEFSAGFLKALHVGCFRDVHWVNGVKKDLNIQECSEKKFLKCFSTEIVMIFTFSSWTPVPIFSWWPTSIIGGTQKCFPGRFLMASCGRSFPLLYSSPQHPPSQDILLERLVILKTQWGVCLKTQSQAPSRSSFWPKTMAKWKTHDPIFSHPGWDCSEVFHIVRSPGRLSPSYPQWGSIHYLTQYGLLASLVSLPYSATGTS